MVWDALPPSQHQVRGASPPDPAWDEHFQARHLNGPPVRGAFRYAEPFRRV